MALDSGRRTGDEYSQGEPVRGYAADVPWRGVASEKSPGDRAVQSGPDAKRAETDAYEAAVKKAFGGKSGMTDVGLPALLFVMIYTATQKLTPALWSAVAVAVALTIVRLFRKETLQHSLSGLLGVLVCAGFAKFSGRPQDFYLPGLLLNVGYAAAFVLSALVRWPIVGLTLGPITGEMTLWRKVPGRLRAFTMATWLLSGVFLLRVAVQLPLYLAGKTTELGVTRLVMGYPLYLAALYFCWQIIKQAPPPLKPEPAEGDPDAAAAAITGIATEGSVADR